jgi:hypothetical protein
MQEIEDWLQDPLMKSGVFLKIKSSNAKQDDKQGTWRLFHYATRLKLGGAHFFYTKVIDTERTLEDELRWYLDAFFFELMAAFDILLQELNITYAYDLNIELKDVRWYDRSLNKFMKKLPRNIVEGIAAERKKDWFYQIKWHRSTTTHQYRIPISSTRGHDSLHLTNVRLLYIDKEGKAKSNEISICEAYLKNMVRLISSIWKIMAEEFEE